jgi:hypothetical protein
MNPPIEAESEGARLVLIVLDVASEILVEFASESETTGLVPIV